MSIPVDTTLRKVQTEWDQLIDPSTPFGEDAKKAKAQHGIQYARLLSCAGVSTDWVSKLSTTDIVSTLIKTSPE